jgi:SAM-dependent methyltransferase
VCSDTPPEIPDAKSCGIETRYRCPRSGAHLERCGTKLRSPAGDAEYEVREDVAQFLRYPSGETDATVQSLRRLNRIAGAEGWRKALAEVYGERSDTFHYVTDPKRLEFLDLLPLTGDSVVLEVGTGLGQITSRLASRAGKVYGLEVVFEQARFALQRCRQEERDNVEMACGGDDCRLPYADGSLDLVIANLVFEWCASRDPGDSFEAGQRRFLAEAHRVLKSRGVLYLATKNRFALKYLLGRADEHCFGQRFGNALPRWLMNRRLKRLGKSRPGGLLHSHGYLRTMLEAAGFARIRSYWAAPEMRFPSDFIATDAQAVREARRRPGFIQGEMRLTRLLMPLIPAPWVKHLTPGLLFIAEKPK